MRSKENLKKKPRYTVLKKTEFVAMWWYLSFQGSTEKIKLKAKVMETVHGESDLSPDISTSVYIFWAIHVI